MQAWRRSGVFPAAAVSTSRSRTTGAFLIAGLNSVTAINPLTGANSWTSTFPASARSVRAAGSVFRVSLPGPDGNASIESFLDAGNGATLWTQSGVSPTDQSIVAASDSLILSVVGDTLLQGRARSSGVVRWTVPVPFGRCSLSFDDCWIDAGRANGAFYLVRTQVLSAQQRLVKITDAGVATVIPFLDPFALGFTVLRGVAIDPTGASLIFSTFIGISAIDAVSGAARWSFRSPILLNADLQEPVLNVTAGSPTLLQVVYPYEAAVNGQFANEYVFNIATGRTVRSRTLQGTSENIASVVPCGETGIAIVRTDGRFVFSDAASGVLTPGTIREPGTNVVAALPPFPDVVGTFAPGQLVLSDANGGMIGFRCRP